MNSVERKAATILSSIGFEVKPFKEKQNIDPVNTIYSQIPFKHMRLDFGLLQAKIAIEINGNYWHGLGLHSTSLSCMQLQNRLNDAKKFAQLSNAGWQLISISESQLSKKSIGNLIRHLILERLII